MSAETFALLVVACLAVNLSPGPSVLLVTSIAASRGFKAGVLAVLGMSAGAFVHVLLAASGIAALLAASPTAFSIVQYLGAGYLIYLGIELLIPKAGSKKSDEHQADTGNWHYFLRGFLVDSLNPKIAIFFLAFIPQFLGSMDQPGFLISLALGSVFLVTGFIVNSSIAYLIAVGTARSRGVASVWIRRWIPAGVLIFLGLRLLWQK